ncbi:hypothetical protein ACIQVK_32005 [Streptomyces sp. NPDC090493]|uniref:hypothetical protein n=1 Tax=Streptomyces sp. NPDC090493 TaxID=3365964 RepID=UPI0037F69ADB
MGAPLARAETDIAITTLLRRHPDYSVAVPDNEFTYQPTVIRALTSLPIKVA